jgi:16S rRNA (cytosine1402-N4)-methyltransferase
MNTRPHQPVMLNEVMEAMALRDNGVYVDGTFGRGGYTSSILSRQNTIVWAFDRDATAIQSGADLQKQYAGRLHLIHDRFANMKTALDEKGVGEVDGVTLDLGVSSPQLDEAERGFSFRHDGPLDMRMGSSTQTAADLVNGADEEDLSNIIYNYGEERLSRRVARAIVAARKEGPITRTAQLASIVRSVVPGSRDGD